MPESIEIMATLNHPLQQAKELSGLVLSFVLIQFVSEIQFFKMQLLQRTLVLHFDFCTNSYREAQTEFSHEFLNTPIPNKSNGVTWNSASGDCPEISNKNTHPGPQLRPIDKGDKEVIKFCRLWQASDKVSFVTVMSTPLKVSTKKWEHYKSDKDFLPMHSVHHFTICHSVFLMSSFFVTLVDGS